MKPNGIVLALLAVCAIAGCQSPAFMNKNSIPLEYPKTRTESVVDSYFGTAVPDPYRWLEDDQSAETAAWVQAQNAVTFRYLESLELREPIRKRMTELQNFERYGRPYRRGERYFFRRNDGLQNQDVYYTAESLSSAPTVLLDPNRLSADGTVSVSDPALTDDGRFAAFLISASGSDWNEIQVWDVGRGVALPDRIQWVKFSGISWTKDGSGFFYSRYDAPKEGDRLKGANHHHQVFFHKLGAPQSEDRLVYRRDDHPGWILRSEVTDDGRYLVITAFEGTDSRNRVFYKDLTVPGSAPVGLLTAFDASYTFVDNDGGVFWFLTDRQAPKGRLVAVDVARPAPENWREVLPQADAKLELVSAVGDRFLAVYLRDAHAQVRIHRLDGTLDRELPLPGIGTVAGFGGKRADRETFFSYSSFTTPDRVYRLDFNTGAIELWKEPKVGFDPDRYETRQEWVTSKDGTRLPIFVTSRKGIRLDGSHPVLLYGYGGFNISITPQFRVSQVVWLEMGGVYAVATLRGGGEYGEEWHQAGTKTQKQNVFDDFIASAEWLIANRYTTSKRLAIHGRSNGGLLVGACMTQRPDLFGACLPAVGVLDMLRFHLFTIGGAWRSDYGSSEKEGEFRALRAYSPYHNLKDGVAYPPTLITTADHDDRVVPAHSFKFAARLQAAHRGRAPVLIRIDAKAGHGAGKPVGKVIEETSDQWAFLAQQFGMREMSALQGRESSKR